MGSRFSLFLLVSFPPFFPRFFPVFSRLTATCAGCDVIHAIRAGAVRASERGCSERKRKSSVTYHRQARRVRVYVRGHVQRYALLNFPCRPNVSSIPAALRFINAKIKRVLTFSRTPIDPANSVVLCNDPRNFPRRSPSTWNIREFETRRSVADHPIDYTDFAG